MSHFDSPDMVPIIAGAIGAAIVAAAVFGLVDMDDTKTEQPLPPPVYATLATTP